MKTLIIHPKDSTTTFLEVVYQNIANKTVLRGCVSKLAVQKAIEQHDRILMLGHGTPYGLFSMGQFPKTNGYIIDDSMGASLRTKKESMFIWCNANQFVKRHHLTGFYTGMFISEVGEANYCGLNSTTQVTVDASTSFFVNQIDKYNNLSTTELYQILKDTYGSFAKSNAVAAYNCQRLYMQIKD